MKLSELWEEWETCFKL